MDEKGTQEKADDAGALLAQQIFNIRNEGRKHRAPEANIKEAALGRMLTTAWMQGHTEGMAWRSKRRIDMDEAKRKIETAAKELLGALNATESPAFVNQPATTLRSAIAAKERL